MIEKYTPKNLSASDASDLDQFLQQKNDLTIEDAEYFGAETNPDSKEYKDLVIQLFDTVTKFSNGKKEFTWMGKRFISTETDPEGWHSSDGLNGFAFYADGVFQQDDLFQTNLLDVASPVLDDDQWKHFQGKVNTYPWTKERVRDFLRALITIEIKPSK